MPADKDVPGTIKRSPAKAQRTYKKTLESAEEQYDDDALKHSYEKVGDHWEPKDEKGPSDPQAKKGGAEARKGRSETFGGVDVEGNSKGELYERAKKLGVKGRSKMSKTELARAIARKQD
jgi:hypothetical protein